MVKLITNYTIKNLCELTTRREKRIRFNAEQKNQLMTFFKTKAYPSPSEYAELSIQLDMPVRSIQIWFQNKRRNVKTQENPDDKNKENIEEPIAMSFPVINTSSGKNIQAKKMLNFLFQKDDLLLLDLTDLQKIIRYIPSVYINYQDKNGNTLLHAACYHQMIEPIKTILTKKHVNLDIRNREGYTSLMMCMNKYVIIYEPIITAFLKQKFNPFAQEPSGFRYHSMFFFLLRCCQISTIWEFLERNKYQVISLLKYVQMDMKRKMDVLMRYEGTAVHEKFLSILYYYYTKGTQNEIDKLVTDMFLHAIVRMRFDVVLTILKYAVKFMVSFSTPSLLMMLEIIAFDHQLYSTAIYIHRKLDLNLHLHIVNDGKRFKELNEKMDFLHFIDYASHL
jgi:Homeodomain-containing transcription factor